MLMWKCKTCGMTIRETMPSCEHCEQTSTVRPPSVLTYENSVRAPVGLLDGWNAIVVEQGPDITRPLERVN